MVATIILLTQDKICTKRKDRIYTKRKEKQKGCIDQGVASLIKPIKYPEDGWSSSLLRMPMFTLAELNIHISSFEKKLILTGRLTQSQLA